MTGVLSSLVEIARLRRDPGALPASVEVLVVMTVFYAGSSALQSWMLHDGDRLLARTAADVGLTFLMFWILLAVTGRGHRFPQTMGAVLGTSVLLTPLVLLLLGLKGLAASYYPIALLAWAGSVGVIVWYTLIVGHILRSALEVGFVTSIAIAMTYLIASAAVLKRLFPEAA